MISSRVNVQVRKAPVRQIIRTLRCAAAPAARSFSSGAPEKPSKRESSGGHNGPEHEKRGLRSSGNKSRKPTIADRAPYTSLDEIPVAQLHQALRDLKTQNGAYHKIVDLVAYLVQRRGEAPGLLHYDALLSASADAASGSAKFVAHLLQEMKDQGIVLDSAVLHSALKALAIHPDYLLRSEVLREMKDRWFNLTTEGWHDWIVGLLRDRQYEVALDKLEQMQREQIKIQPWLYDVFTYLLCESEELDEALKLLRYRAEHGDMDISPNVWYSVLDACCSNHHYEGTLYVWKKRVEMGYLNPSDGMCTNVINIAARNGDSNLATDVVRILAGRTSRLDMHHYEALIEAYIGSSDLRSALQILSIMKKVGLEPKDGSVRPIYTHISQENDLPSRTLDILQELKQEGRVVPTAAFNVILEASVRQGKMQEAFSQYKLLHKICDFGPNTSTFNTLLQGCAKGSGNKDLAMFIAAEMAALAIRPDALTYDRLVLVCLMEDDYEDAFRYLAEMKRTISKSELRSGTVHAFVRKCVTAGDERAWTLLSELEVQGRNMGKLRMWARENWGRTQESLEEPSEAEEPHMDGRGISAA
jgi:hypothetical protein